VTGIRSNIVKHDGDAVAARANISILTTVLALLASIDSIFVEPSEIGQRYWKVEIVRSAKRIHP